ncbi:erythromycin resistance leader peptide [Robertmurraya siralis]
MTHSIRLRFSTLNQ